MGQLQRDNLGAREHNDNLRGESMSLREMYEAAMKENAELLEKVESTAQLVNAWAKVTPDEWYAEH